MRIKSNLQDSEFEELSRPKLKLFMSVDIVGSTHFKQRETKGQNQNWLNLFISFFTEFPSLFNSEIAGSNASLLPAKLWKSLGDELIFTVELKRRQSAVLYIKALRRALRKAAGNWHSDAKEPDRKDLHLKGAAWLVGFPVGNVEIPLISSSVKEGETVSDSRNDDRDYIGPLVDMGFRLKENASSRKLVISADLAYLMLASGIGGDMVLFYEDEVPLKGVLGGKPYPIIWVDCDGHPEMSGEGSSARMNRLKDSFRGKKAADQSDLQSYLKLWLHSVKNCPCIPFVEGDLDEDFKPAAEFEVKRKEAVANLKKNFYPDNSDSVDQQGSESVPSEVSSMIDRIPARVTAKKQAHKTAKKRNQKDK